MTMSQQWVAANVRPGCRGFSLVEVLIAMLILAVGMLALASMQLRSIRMNASARMQTEATAIAVDWLERLIALPFDDPLLDAGDPHRVTLEPYRIVWQVSAGPIGMATKTINLEVSASNRNARRVLLSLIKDRDL